MFNNCTYWISNTCTVKSGLIVLLFLSLQCAIAQNSDLQYGKVPSSDITMKAYPSEPNADAAILAKKTVTLFVDGLESGQISKHFERIKLFKASAFDLAKIIIEYYHYDELEQIEELNAMVTYPDGGVYHLSKKNVTKQRVGNEWTQIALTFPNLKEGCIIEYEYILKKDYISSPDDFVFQYDFPVRHAELQISFPDQFEYIHILQGKDYIEAEDGIFTMKDIPSLYDDLYSTGYNNHQGKIKTRINSYYDSFLGKQELNPSVQLMLKKLSKEKLFGQQYKNKINSNKIISDARMILAQPSDVLDKILSLQKFLLDQITWNGKMEIYSEKGIAKAYKSKSASSTELNFMLISLLKAANIEAYPVLVSTRDNGQAYNEFPILDDFSYAIILAKVNGSNLLLDISDPLKPPTLLNFAALNKYGLVVQDKEPFWIEIIPEQVSDVYLTEFKINGEILEGKFQSKHSNYSAYLERDYTRDENYLKHWKLRLQEKFPRTYISEGKQENLDQVSEPFKQEFRLEIPDGFEKTGDTVLISPFLYGNYDKNPFQLKERTFDVDFGYPFVEQAIFQLDLGEEYEVVKLPEPFAVTTEDRAVSFMITSTVIGNQVQIIKKFDVDKAVFAPEEYQSLKNIFEKIEDKINEELLVIKKVR